MFAQYCSIVVQKLFQSFSSSVHAKPLAPPIRISFPHQLDDQVAVAAMLNTVNLPLIPRDTSSPLSQIAAGDSNAGASCWATLT